MGSVSFISSFASSSPSFVSARNFCPILTFQRVSKKSRPSVRACDGSSSKDKSRAHVAQTTFASAPPVPSPTRPSDKKFSWVNQWYAVFWEIDVEDNKPYSFFLFDIPLVLFRAADGSYVVFDDECPHRGAPLSEGRVIQREDGTALECPYHGWTFNCSGTCVRIPQIPATQAIPDSFSARKYPCITDFGAIFVWLGDSALATPDKVPVPILLREHRARNGQGFVQTNIKLARYLPYDFQTLIENLLDPAHAPWSHHGTVWLLRREFVSDEDNVRLLEHDPDLGHMNFERTLNQKFHKNKKEPTTSQATFQAPTLLTYYSELPDGSRHSTNFILSSAGPNRSRILEVDVISSPKRSWASLAISLYSSMFPRWIAHFVFNRVFDGDTPLLRGQEATLRTRYHGNWSKMYRAAPSGCDAPLRAFRFWMDKVLPAAPWRNPESAMKPPPEISRRELLDRYWTHTVHCTSCRGALRNTRFLRNVAMLVLFGSVGTTGFAWYLNLRSTMIFAVIGAFLSAIIARWAESLRQGFFYTNRARMLYENS